MLSVRSLSVLSVCPVCNVRALWPNRWTDQDETWHAGRPRPWPLCVRWGPSSPSPKGGGAPQFLADICCSQMAGWIKMPLGMEVGLVPGHIVLDGNPAPPKFLAHVYYSYCDFVSTLHRRKALLVCSSSSLVFNAFYF